MLRQVFQMLLLTPLVLSTLACSGKGGQEQQLTPAGEHVIKGGYTVRFEGKPDDGLKGLRLLGDPLGTLCRHPGIETSEGLNKVWLYSFESQAGSNARSGYAILERGGGLLVSGWSTTGSQLDKKGLWTVLRDVKKRFGCSLPIKNPFPPPK